MNATVVKKNILPFSLLALSIVSAEWWIVHSLMFQRNPDLIATGVTLDLVVVIPALYYFFVTRPRKSSPLALIPCFGLCLAVAMRLVPADHRDFLYSLKSLSPLLELVVIGYLALRLRMFIRAYREAKTNAVYFTDALFAGFKKALSDRAVFNIIFVEFFLLYFSLAGWFLKTTEPQKGQSQFTYHRKSGYAAILSILMMVMAMETVAVHMIVSHWNIVTAWILSVLSVYGALWLVGDYHAIRVHPIVVTADTLHLRTGMRWRADISRGDVEDVVVGAPEKRKSADYLRASILWPRATIVLKRPVEVEGLFGRRKTVSRIGVSLDDPDSFRSALAS